MKEYTVTSEYCGYIRGNITYKVLAESEEDALRKYQAGEEICNDIIRDDTETTDVWIST